MHRNSEPPFQEYNGLNEVTAGIPAHDYFDPRRYALEMQQIWHRHWVYAGRSSDVSEPRSYRTFDLGDQRVLLVRDEQGVLRAFHNTCRHRGAALCRENSGTLSNASIVCPYHAWVYNLRGELVRTSSAQPAEGFNANDFPLYKVAVHEWEGFVFVALNEFPPPFAECFDVPIDRLNAWPLKELAVGHVLTKLIHCNWKIFWENYNECLHCPGVHAQLARLVPIFARGLMEERDDPRWREHSGDLDPKFRGGLRMGAHTWSSNGNLTGAPFPNLTPEDRRVGHVYMTALPSMFIVGHADYVRVVRLLPHGPEQTELRVEYLFSPETLRKGDCDLRNVVEFTDRVMTEDAQVCELNQRGLRAVAHLKGVLMPEEYLIRRFHQWIESEIARI